ncbi:isochorismatase family protein [Streptomyces canus]|uniref:isochorismatase family protein n=1 Tax=Streptomyces canus TaxID=58343 RepID=UPI00039F0B5D|nr:isochorismatase family protein [Streptomyces canus]
MYSLERTALVLIDATNDFISENGKGGPGLRVVCEAVGTVPNMKRVLDVAREAGIAVLHATMETDPWAPGASDCTRISRRSTGRWSSRCTRRSTPSTARTWTSSRDAVEKGYEVTFVSDAVATFTMEMQHATVALDWP